MMDMLVRELKENLRRMISMVISARQATRRGCAGEAARGAIVRARASLAEPYRMDTFIIL